MEGLIPSGLRIKKRPPVNAISDTFEGQWIFVFYGAEKKLVQLLLQESKHTVNQFETQIKIEIRNDYTTTGSTKHKQLQEKHVKFRQQLEYRRAKKWKKFKESSKGKFDGVVQERGIRGGNETSQILDGRSEPLKKTESDILQLNVTNSLLTDNKERDSIFKEIDWIGEKNNFLKNVCLDNITDNWKLRSRKNRTYADAVSGTKKIGCEPVKDIQKVGKSALGKRDDKLLGYESIDLESIHVRLAEVGSISEDPPSPPNICTDISVVQNSSSSDRNIISLYVSCFVI